MYKILGSDGKEYGPATLDPLKQCSRHGRINSETKVLIVGETDWNRAGDVREIALLLPQPTAASSSGASPPKIPYPGRPQQQNGLAITSFVLGLLAMLCFGLLTGIPA